ncbi:MAG: type II toxin-antitoxin system VapC family toxin [Egibacteraceae bacterium]
MADPTIVVDAGVVLRWYVPQVSHEHAREVRDQLREGAVALRVPEAARYEFGHALRVKGVLGGHVSRAVYVSAVRLLDDLGLVEPLTADVLQRAAGMAVDRSLQLFDALYAELASRLGVRLLTNDAKLARAVGDIVDVDVLRGIGGDEPPESSVRR